VAINERLLLATRRREPRAIGSMIPPEPGRNVIASPSRFDGWIVMAGLAFIGMAVLAEVIARRVAA